MAMLRSGSGHAPLDHSRESLAERWFAMLHDADFLLRRRSSGACIFTKLSFKGSAATAKADLAKCIMPAIVSNVALTSVTNKLLTIQDMRDASSDQESRSLAHVIVSKGSDGAQFVQIAGLRQLSTRPTQQCEERFRVVAAMCKFCLSWKCTRGRTGCFFFNVT